jgi:uroporphyrinogen III methyltransferase / synthase
VAAANPEIAEAVETGSVDWVTVTSSAIARSLVKLFGDDLRRSKLAAISPLTAETIAELGHSSAAIADVYTADGLVAAILAGECDRS